MTKVERFQDNEIPYELLASFGLSQEMVDDLPQKVLEQLLSGQRTPLLPICNVDENGNCNNSLARLSLVRTEDGIDVIFSCPAGKANCWKSLNYSSNRLSKTEEPYILLKKMRIISWIMLLSRLFPCRPM